jgi:hypothetical protein
MMRLIMNDARRLLVQVERFLSDTGMAGSTLGTYAVNNGHLVDHLRAGGDLRTTTAQRVRAFMKNYRRSKGASREAAG